MTPVEARAIASSVGDAEEASLGDLLAGITGQWRTVAGAAIASGSLGLGVAFMLPPIYTANAVVMPPQQQGGAAAALGSLGALAGLAGGSVKSPIDQYVSLMMSSTVADRVADQFKLDEVYEQQYRSETKKILSKKVSITAGKKDGLIFIEVDDKDPKRAAQMARAYIDGLQYMTNNLAVTEAQQRRSFFENKLKETKDRLTKAQIELQAVGFNVSAIKVEPKAAAEVYAKVNAELTAAEVRLTGMKSMLADRAPEIVQQQAVVASLRAELNKIERNARPPEVVNGSSDYITKYREFKYQEALFDLFARQYETARLDESREGTLIQVVDEPSIPDRKSKPKRAFIVMGSAIAGLFTGIIWVLIYRSRKML